MTMYNAGMSRIIVSGSIAYDRIMDFSGMFAEHFIPDKAHAINLSFRAERLSLQFGGTAGNIAYNLALLGETPEIIATAGSDFSSYRSHLLLTGIDPTPIRVLTENEEMTSSAYIFTDKADNQIAAFFEGAGGHSYDTPVETEGRALAIVAAGCTTDMNSLPSYYRQRGMKYLYDPGQQIPVLTGDELSAAISGSAVLFATDHELQRILEKTGWNETELVTNAQAIVTTFGAQGSRIITAAKGALDVQAVPANAVVDSTGAGDAYRAGFIKGMLAGKPLDHCARIGSAVAAYVVEAYGTQAHRFTLDDVKHRYRSVYGEDLSL